MGDRLSKKPDRYKLINIFCATLIFLTAIGTESALAILCERTSNDYSGWRKKANMDSWFNKNLFIEDSKLKGAPTGKSLTYVEKATSKSGRKTVLKYKLLANGKMVVVMTQGHFKSTQRYKCDRTPVEIKARLLKLEEDKKRALQKKADAKNKAEEEAKKAARLAAKKKAEEEAKKAAKLAAKKKAEEEAKLANARAAVALIEATDFYKDFVMFIKSGADKDVVKSAQLFSTKPEITDKWSKTELDRYNEFKATALKNLEFNDFHRKRVQNRLTEASKIRTEKELALKSALPELLSILTEAFGSEDGNQALALKQKIEDVLQAFDQQTEETLNKTEQEVTNFLKYMEKQREKEQQKQQMRAELVQNLKSKLADLETLLTTHFGEPKGEKAASLIEKISSLTDENTEALS